MAIDSQGSTRRVFLRRMAATTATSEILGLLGLNGAGARDALGVTTGAASIVAAGFSSLMGMRVDLITNQTGRADHQHLVYLLRRAPSVRLAAILAPEHGG